jgi:hypothetical protein
VTIGGGGGVGAESELEAARRLGCLMCAPTSRTVGVYSPYSVGV